MMATKKLDGEALQKFEKYVLDEKTPEDISKLLGISVSSVHNYKRAMRENGINVPNVRGKRPQEYKNVPIRPFFDPEILKNAEHNKFIELTVNGVNFHISPESKNVIVENGKITVEI
jgi:hypothetical protein